MRRWCLLSCLAHALPAVLLVCFFAPSARGTINETLSCALEAAMPYVEKGFTVREEHWQGKFGLGEKKAIKHQLFKGNEYWFWLGSATKGVTLSVKVYDSKGRPVDVETKVEETFAAARVLAPKTGTYYIVIKAVAKETDGEDPEEEKEGEEEKKVVEWAVVYGFR